MKPKIILHAHSLEIIDPQYVEKIQADFNEFGFSKLSHFLSDDIKKIIEKNLDSTNYFYQDHVHLGYQVGQEEIARGGIFHLLTFAMNHAEVLNKLAAIVDHQPLKSFIGRHYIYRDNQSSLGWHNDAVLNRHLAITININPDYYLGGNLEFKPKMQKSDHPTIVASNKFFGDAILFPVTKEHLHRVNPVVNGTTKIAFAGWFYGKDLLPTKRD